MALNRDSLFTENVKARITPSLMADMKQIAESEQISISRLFREMIADHLINKGWQPSQEEREAIYRRPRLRAVNAGSVYLIKCGGAYKIGRTRNLGQRLMQMSLPFKPRIVRLCSYADPGFVELSLHEMFKHRRLNGEWFALEENEVLIAKAFMAEQE